ncbi:MAG: hypothetical protein KIT60_10470 [Burkholderiaceae bacterium]|nr:hypothetical protein [Burkholderiaceae bacterium]
MKSRSRLRLTAIFLSGLAVTAVTLAVLERVTEAGASPRPTAARIGEAPPPLTPTQAHALFLDGRYAEAYGRYAALADAGDSVAASMALTLVVHGPAVFGSDWSATSDQWQRWSALAQQLAGQRVASIVAHDRAE